MTMAPRLRKFALTAHVVSSVGLLGAIAGFLALAVAGLTSQNDQMVRAAYLAMDLIARFVILALAFASLLTGLIQSVGTPWGLFRHYWVLVRLLLTAFATIVLLVKMELIGYAARLSAETTVSRADLRAAGIQLLIHASGGLLVLLVPAVLAIYKPPGMTRYGWRKQHEQPALSQSILSSWAANFQARHHWLAESVSGPPISAQEPDRKLPCQLPTPPPG